MPSSPQILRRVHPLALTKDGAPTSARNISAPSTDLFDKVPSTVLHNNFLKVKDTPPATPPRSINSPSVQSPSCTSPNPLKSSVVITKPSPIPSVLKAQARGTPPATPPRPSNLSASSPRAGNSPNVFSPPSNAVKPLDISSPANATPNLLSPRGVFSPASKSTLGASSGAGESLTPRSHLITPSSRTPDVSRKHSIDSGESVHNHIFSLKSSHGITVVKSPMAKDYLLSQSTPSKADTPTTRSKSPLPRSPAVVSSPACGTPTKTRKHSDPPPCISSPVLVSCSSPCDTPGRVRKLSEPPLRSSPIVVVGSPACDTPGRVRKLSEPPARSSPFFGSPAFDTPGRARKMSESFPIQFDHLQRNILKGSCDSISMPYNVTHTTVDLATLKSSVDGHDMVVINNNSMYEKSGYLHKLAGSNFKERWFECKRCILSYYNKKDSSKPRREIYLTDCEFRRDKTSKRLHTLHVLHTPTKKNYYFSAASAELMEEWIRVFHSCGAIDKDFVVMEQDYKEQERKEEEARQVREMKKQEDEYVRAKIKKRSTLKITNKNMSDCQMETCLCILAVQEIVEKDSGQEFKINVTFDDQVWTIYRNYEKIIKLHETMAKLKLVKDMCPPRKRPSSMPEADFVKLRISKLQAMLDTITKHRPAVIASATPRQRFLRFIAPVGWEDFKPDKFIMPFQFDF